MKLTKRKAFSFLRSYFDVFNKLQTDEDKLAFLTAIINKQFLNEDPKELKFPVDLAYESQINAIDSSVKGWMRASKTDLQGKILNTPPTPPQGKTHYHPKEEEEEEKEKDVVVYSNNDFIEDFNQHRKRFMDIDALMILKNNERYAFEGLLKTYNKQDFRDAISGLFKFSTLDACKRRPAWLLEEANFIEMRDGYRNKKNPFKTQMS